MKTAKVRAFFNALIELYSKDTHHVYYRDQEIEGADSPTFEMAKTQDVVGDVSELLPVSRFRYLSTGKFMEGDNGECAEIYIAIPAKKRKWIR